MAQLGSLSAAAATPGGFAASTCSNKQQDLAQASQQQRIYQEAGPGLWHQRHSGHE